MVKEIPIGVKLDELADEFKAIKEEKKEIESKLYGVEDLIKKILKDNELDTYQTEVNLFELKSTRKIDVKKAKKVLIKTIYNRIAKSKVTISVSDAEAVCTEGEMKKIVTYPKNPRLFVKIPDHLKKRKSTKGKKNGYGGETVSV